ncbi:MAG: hypothetical protein Q7J03_03720 [Methanoregula sp.]|nr:hypothetical protein [Methanoregula sp.]
MKTNDPQSPITRLIVFIVCLALAGSFVAVIHYFAVDLPQQNAIQAPENRGIELTSCQQGCIDAREVCLNSCSADTCVLQCQSAAGACYQRCPRY